MALYSRVENDAHWPQPLEETYQLLGGGEASDLAPKLPHLGLADILFMATVMSMPKERRPWGIVTWMASAFLLSRPALYALTARTQERLLSPPVREERRLSGTSLSATGLPTIELTPERLARTVLTAAFPGKVALRPMQQVLAEALDTSRSVGWLSELLSEAGQRAGQVLAKIDTAPLGKVIAVRDETFFNDQPLLMLIDPVSSTILQLVVAPDCQADTWATVLLMAEDQGATLEGLVEDMARAYPKSIRDAEMKLDIQKDVWHIERDGGTLRLFLEKAALRATKRVLALEEKLLEAWDDRLFEEEYIPAVATEERRYDRHAAFCDWYGHLCDALEVVDWRSGEIRDVEINSWLLEETLSALEQIDHERVQEWVRTLRRHQHNLLTCLAWLADSLNPYEQALARVLPDAQARTQFMRRVAKVWRLRQALINGHSNLGTAAQIAQENLTLAIGGSPILTRLAQRLRELLDGACRASSLIESLNGLLKQFLHARRSLYADSLQRYLNLFTLWHNMRVYERGKRQGQSPYQRAGIQTSHEDWLALLGYPTS